MPWVWSDELVARLVEVGVVDAGAVQGGSPVAWAVGDASDPVELGRTLLGLDLDPVVS